jgi:5-methyltetrahydropteroyltriglutamate--homocysteine methyltransferase
LSFVRDDQPVAATAMQVALALRDEVADLEKAGIAIIQVDEPGLREMLPLQRHDRDEYLQWAVDAFRLATSGVRDDTQIHTHMCCAEFGDILAAIHDLDVDVISLEAARSHMQTTRELAETGHSYGIGPGVYDIHAPRIPHTNEIARQLHEAAQHVPAARLWANPDCGLKTRTEAQVTEALRNMVTAARELRAELSAADRP